MQYDSLVERLIVLQAPWREEEEADVVAASPEPHPYQARCCGESPQEGHAGKMDVAAQALQDGPEHLVKLVDFAGPRTTRAYDPDDLEAALVGLKEMKIPNLSTAGT